METLQRTANRGSVSTGYDIDNSVKLEDDNDEYLTRTNASGTNRKTFTVSAWFKQTELATQLGHITEIWDGGTYGEATRMGVYSDDRLWVDVAGGTGNTGTQFRSLSTLKLRDTSAWYHMVLAVDTTQSTEANRMKVWLNGAEVTAWDQHQIPTEDYQCSLESGTTMSWGSYNSTYHGFSGYLAECNYLDGVTATQNDFGEYDSDTGIWIPKKYTGSYAGQSAYLDFSDASDLGANSKGDDVNFSLVNISAADQATDTPTNNFCTLNPLIYDINSGDDESYSCFNGATSIAASKNAYAQNYATIGLNIASGGKWYFEWTATSTANGSSSEGLCGIAFDTQWDAGSNSTAVYNAGYAYYAAGFGSGDGYAANVVNGFLIDLDNNKIKWYKDGTLHITMPDDGGGSTMQTSGYAFPYIAPYGSGYTINVNFGGYTAQAISSGNTDPDGYGNFEYPTQDGYAICTKNLAEYG
jgi:hypothetical protein